MMIADEVFTGRIVKKDFAVKVKPGLLRREHYQQLYSDRVEQMLSGCKRDPVTVVCWSPMNDSY